MPSSGEEQIRWLHKLGWSVGEVGFVETDGQTTWVVSARRGAKIVMGRSPSQAEAWAQAVRKAADADDTVG